MPALLTALPEPGTYKYVAYLPTMIAAGDAHSRHFSAYDESTLSVALALADKMPRHTIFLNHKSSHDRAIRDGWVDCTRLLHSKIYAARPKVSTLGQRAIMAALTKEYKSKAVMLTHSGVPDTVWRTAIKTLQERGLATISRKTASNHKIYYRQGKKYHLAIDTVDEVSNG